jgi:hypothetical protein
MEKGYKFTSCFLCFGFFGFNIVASYIFKKRKINLRWDKKLNLGGIKWHYLLFEEDASVWDD